MNLTSLQCGMGYLSGSMLVMGAELARGGRPIRPSLLLDRPVYEWVALTLSAS